MHYIYFIFHWPVTQLQFGSAGLENVARTCFPHFLLWVPYQVGKPPISGPEAKWTQQALFSEFIGANTKYVSIRSGGKMVIIYRGGREDL